MSKLLSLLVLLFASISALAGVIAQDPLFISAQADPRVLLLISRDHQLFAKAYTDYTDIDGDGSIDIKFKGHIEYDGYFNPRKCYTYQNSRFEPTANATAESVTVSGQTKTQYVCNSSWSGGFLNWATMTRMDLVRKVLYGGYRYVDNGPGDTPANLTVLERAHIPDDVHSFVKVYEPDGASDTDKRTVMAKFTPYGSETAISLCNATRDGTRSRDSVESPKLYVAKNKYTEWSAGESAAGDSGQCQPAHISATDKTGMPVDTPLIVRVLVCNDTNDGIAGPGPKCKTYLNGTTKKPVGLLQIYGDPDASLGLRFGLMTGSWQRNKDGGVLRKNVGLLSNNAKTYPNSYDCSNSANGANANDEVNFCTGQFVNNQKYSYSSSNALPSWGGIIGTLNRFRISGYKRRNYEPTNCSQAGILQFANGDCADWGNPLSEMYLEALRYVNAANAIDKLEADLSAAAATPAFTADDSTYINGLPIVSWRDPIPAKEWCAKSNIVVLSTGLNSFDSDKTANSFTGWPTTADLTNSVASAAYENLSGDFLVGSNNGLFLPSATCSEKTLGNFSQFLGICPEVPNLGGSYHIAGLALGTALYDLRPGYRNNRNSLWGVTNPSLAQRQPLNTYAIALAESMPQFTVPIGGAAITFVPSLRAWATERPDAANGIVSSWQSGSIADLSVLPGSTPTKGAIRIVWENASWGSDYDQDAVHLIRYCTGTDCLGYSDFPASVTPEANRLYIKLSLMATAASRDMEHGYSLTGSTSDGYVVVANGTGTYTYNAAHETTRATGSSWTYNTDSNTTVNSPVWRSFAVSASGTARSLKNPLWYTAKYAGWPNWDVKLNDSNRTAGSDGIPDNFFQVRNPAGLDAALSSALRESLGDASSASSIAANSTRLDTDTFIYQARFKALDWSGQVLAYPLTNTGGLGTLAWDAASSAKIPSAALRRVFSFNRSATTKGIELTWDSLSGAMKAGLDNVNSAETTSPILSYLKGDQSLELTDANNDGVFESGIYRKRPTSIFGDVINADPLFVGNQNYAYGTISAITGYDSYQTQVLKKIDSSNSVRNPLLLVNSNDGMMHAIDGKNGNEVFAYMPSWLLCPYQSTDGTACFADSALSISGNNVSPLRLLTNAGYQHRYMLDGALAVGDAYVDKGTGASWRTIVVGAAAAGGKGIFALDLTASYDGSGTTSTTSLLSETMTAYANLSSSDVAMWEFTDKDYDATSGADGDADLGYTYGVPIIGRLANGEWGAIFANGYNSATGKAALFIVNLATGKLIKKIEVGDGATTSSPNGLSSPAAVFNSATGAFSAVYAGDLKGNLWKFDLSSATPSSWAIEHGSGKPLFVARDDTGVRQPITGPLEIGTHTGGGYMIYFGTGKYFEKNDDSTTSLQTIYAIWDKTQSNDDISDASTDTAAEKRTVLQEHKIIAEGTNPFDTTGQTKIRVTDDVGAVAYSGGGAKRGWYLNLQVEGGSLLGERVVSAPILRNRRIIYTTIIPNGSPCEFGGTGWIMEFDPMSGNRLSESVFDLNGDGQFSSADYVSITVGGQTVQVPANGIRSTEGMIRSPTIISGGGKEYKISSGTTGNVLVVKEKGSSNRARASWRQIR